MATILIVEDSDNQRLLLAEELRDEGYTVRSAASGQEALNLASAATPDLVVLDIAMPGMDGIEVLSKMLAMNNRLPVILYTAYAHHRDNFMAWGADAYVLKQSELAELKHTVRAVLAKSPRNRVAPSTKIMKPSRPEYGWPAHTPRERQMGEAK